VVSQLKVNEIIKQSGSSITIGEAGDSITFPSTGTASGIYTNTPVWRAKITSQSLGYNSATKIDYNQELQDTASAYDTSNKRFTVPSGLGGTYMIGGWYRIGTSTNVEAFSIFPYVNGSTVDSTEQIRGAMVQQNYNTIQCSGLLELSASDYIEMYAFNNDSNANYDIGYSNEGMFWGFKLIGA
tara:strand:+ start:282 stop:833 length:552 start_codon:yes stop_codon:yes gene_type:complete